MRCEGCSFISIYNGSGIDIKIVNIITITDEDNNSKYNYKYVISYMSVTRQLFLNNHIRT